MRSFVLLLGVVVAAAAVALEPSVPCPQFCRCRFDETNRNLEAVCTTMDFVKKLQPKQIHALTSLTITHTSATQIEPQFKSIHNLQKLDLSYNNITSKKIFPILPKLTHLNLTHNQITHLSPEDLPTTLISLDISWNLIKYLPESFIYLPMLRYIDFRNNPIHCDCTTTALRAYFIKSNTTVATPVTCQNQELRGLRWDDPSICPPPKSASIWSVTVLNDAPLEEGSGSGFLPEDGVDEHRGAIIVDEGLENEFIPQLGPLPEESPLEGSGDYERPKACHINCSTPPPIEERNETAVVVGPFEAIKILTEDVAMIGGSGEVSSTTNRAVVIITPDVSSTPKIEVKTEATEVFERKQTNGQFSENIKEDIPEAKESNSTYILLAVLCGLVLMLVLYALMKNRRSRARRRRSDDFDDVEKKAQAMTELKPLGKQQQEQDDVPEKVPLMNGQNGTASNGNLDEVQNRCNDEHDYVELRKKQDGDHLLTPEAKRVTIKAGELPESIPRTPLLVNRHISSDGNVVTTPTSDQRL